MIYEEPFDVHVSDDYHNDESYRKQCVSRFYRDGREEQQRVHFSDRCTHVQAFINNIATTKSLKQLLFYINEMGCYSVEDILQNTETNWTVPRWAKPGDIVFFMHSKTSRSSLTALRTSLNASHDQYSEAEVIAMNQWIDRGLQLHAKYGGNIFALGRVTSLPELADDVDPVYHWSSRAYADISDITLLQNPIPIQSINSFLQISRVSGITPVFGSEYTELKVHIMQSNSVPLYFAQSNATPLPLAKINHENWLQISNEYRRSFLLECQYRTYYINHLLHSLSDRKHIFRECRCKKTGIPDSFVDNIISFDGRLLPVEIKLTMPPTSKIIQQVSKYCEDDQVFLNKDRIADPQKIYRQHVLVIDTESVFLYHNKSQNLSQIFYLDKLKKQSDIRLLAQTIRNALLN